MAEIASPEPLAKRNITFQLVAPTRGGGGGSVGTSGGFDILGGAHFRYSFEVPPMLTADALTVRAWLHSMRGGGNYTLLNTPPAANSVNTTFRDDANAGQVFFRAIDVAAAVRGAIVVVGNPASASNDVQIHRVTSVSNFTVFIEPPLRHGYTAGNGLRFGEQTARFRLVGSTPSIRMRPQRSEPFTISLEEVI